MLLRQLQAAEKALAARAPVAASAPAAVVDPNLAAALDNLGAVCSLLGLDTIQLRVRIAGP